MQHLLDTLTRLCRDLDDIRRVYTESRLHLLRDHSRLSSGQIDLYFEH